MVIFWAMTCIACNAFNTASPLCWASVADWQAMASVWLAFKAVFLMLAAICSIAADACSAAASVPAKETAPPPIRRLDQLPPGRLELAVLRTIGGCNVASVKQGDRIIYLPAPTATPRPVPAAHAR